jgi:hypothetical protein
MKSILLFSFILFTHTTSAQSPWHFEVGSRDSFIEDFVLTDKAHEPLSQYFSKWPRSEVQNYSELLLKFQKSRLLKTLNSGDLQSSAGCIEKSHAQFGPLTQEGLNPQQNQSEIRDFESGLILIENQICLQNTSFEKILSVFMSGEFSRAASSALKEHRENPGDNSICQVTSRFGVGKSHYCIRLKLLKNENSIVIITTNDYNNPQMNAPLYTRWVMTVFQKQNDGQIVFHTLTLARGQDIPFKSLVLSAIKKESENYKQIFKQWLLK